MTHAQAKYIQALVMYEALGPQLAELDEAVRGVNRAGGFVSIKATGQFHPTSPPQPPEEPSDMREVVPACHPAFPFKVAEDWGDVVFCPYCARKAKS